MTNQIIQKTKADSKRKAIASLLIGIIALVANIPTWGGVFWGPPDAPLNILRPLMIVIMGYPERILVFLIFSLLISITGLFLGKTGLKSAKRGLAITGIILSITGLLGTISFAIFMIGMALGM